MKSAIQFLSILLIVLFAACDKNESKLDTNVLPGKWKLSESWSGDGSVGSIGNWKPTKKQVVVEFKSDGSLAGNAFEGYGSYVVKNSNTLVLIKADKTEQNYTYTLEDGKLTLSPAGPNYCIEGCADRYSKTN